mgnify:CR=1 FL=1
MLLKKSTYVYLLILFTIIIFFFIYHEFNKEEKISETITDVPEDTIYSSNIIENVFYNSKDASGNEYIIKALKGEIDHSNSNIIFLTNVKATIKLKNSSDITISSNYGKYNIENYDTIFSKNVLIKYIDNNIKGEYLDFSLNKNMMIISREVTYTNTENFLKADVIEMNLKTKDIKIFMYEKEKKIKIKNKK